jgi:plasmid stabilization system protein ParE
MKLRLTIRATADLSDLADYIHERSPAAALRVRAAILDSLQRLVLFPKFGHAQSGAMPPQDRPFGGAPRLRLAVVKRARPAAFVN